MTTFNERFTYVGRNVSIAVWRVLFDFDLKKNLNKKGLRFHSCIAASIYLLISNSKGQWVQRIIFVYLIN